MFYLHSRAGVSPTGLCRINFQNVNQLRCLPLKTLQDGMLDTKRIRFPLDVILVCIHWYAAYSLSYRNLDEMMHERCVFVDHSSISRWAIRFLPLLEKIFRTHKSQMGSSWHVDETYIKVKGMQASNATTYSEGRFTGRRLSA